MDQHAASERAAIKPPKPARVALSVLALCFTLSVLGRGLGESFTVFLKPISESFGWDRAAGGLGLFAVRARRRTGGSAGRPAVRPLGATHRLFARTVSAGRGVPGRRPCPASLAIPAQPRPLRRHRHRLYRQRAEFDPARPLVRPATADRHGGGVFRDRRRRADPVAGVANPDRSGRLARRLPDFRRHRAGVAGAAIGAAMAPVLRWIAAPGQERHRRYRRRGLDAAERDAPSCLLGLVLDLLLHRDRDVRHRAAGRRLSDRCRISAAAGGDGMGI